MSAGSIPTGLVMMLAACTGSTNGGAPLPSVAASFEGSLPSTASVAVYDDKGTWGDAVSLLLEYGQPSNHE